MLSITALLEVLKEDSVEPTSKAFAGAIPLNEAVLCVDCQTITQRIREGRCGHCGSDSVMHLSIALQGPREMQEELPPSGIEMAFGEFEEPTKIRARSMDNLT
jgi:hypothetical protein